MTKTIEEKIADLAKDQAIDFLIKKISKTLHEVLDTMGVKVVTGVFEAKPISLWKDSYKRTAQQMYTKSLQMSSLHEEIQSYNKDGKARDPQIIMKDIQILRTQLTNDVQLLTISYGGIIREKELDKYTCPQTLELHHRSLIQMYGLLMALP